jgi:hypothetical protein
MDLVQQQCRLFKTLHPQGLEKPDSRTTSKIKEILTTAGYDPAIALKVSHHVLAANGVVGISYKLLTLKKGQTYLDVARALLEEHAPARQTRMANTVSSSDDDDDEVSNETVSVVKKAAKPTSSAATARTDATDYVADEDASRVLVTQQKKNLTTALNKVLPSFGHGANSETGKKVKKMVRAMVEMDADLQRAIPVEAGADLSKLFKVLMKVCKDRLQYATSAAEITDKIKAVRI